MDKVYMCIDLKSFYASVECVERGLDPINTNLVVADKSRTEKTICLAVSPSLKEYGIPGRARLFEVIEAVKEINNERKKKAKYHRFTGHSYLKRKLAMDDNLELDFIIASPRMKYYMNYSTKIYNIYLKYLAPEDIYVYSIDEVFCDITKYLKLYKMTPRELVTKMIKDVYDTTGITATSGIGTNMYLAKIAMDVVAKHVEANEFGVRIAELNEETYKKLLWNHKPLTSFWRVGKGLAKRLEDNGIYTMGDIARKSLEDEEFFYKLFGVNAELLIDHAWGVEPTTIEDIRKYKPKSNSLSSGQVLHEPYNFTKAKLIVKEMMELLSLELVEKRLITDKLVLTIGYDIENLTNPRIKNSYNGEITIDRYGRRVPKHAHGTINIDHKTSSTELLVDKIVELYERIVNSDLLIRRINIAACSLVDEDYFFDVKNKQYDLFVTDNEEENNVLKIKEQKERNLQRVMLELKNKYGKNSILKGMNLEKGATTIDRNGEIGGHKG